MQSSLKEFSVSAEHLALWLDYLALEPGFCLLHRPDGSVMVSAWPAQEWRVPVDLRPDQRQALVEALAKAERGVRESHQESSVPGVFCAGLVGALDYEAGIHTVPGFRSSRAATGSATLGWIGQFWWGLTISPDGDSVRGAIHPNCPAETLTRLAPLIKGERPAPLPGRPFRIQQGFQPLQSPDEYARGVSRVLAYIHAGDCYQVNLSQRFEGRFEGRPFDAFRALRAAIPVPHAAFINTGGRQILSISPERLLSIRGDRVESKPIKGTRPRGANAQEDANLKRELETSDKDRAENLMIVDLIRNDLSRFCQPHTVAVPKLFTVESYRNVHQLVSTVTGRLQPGVGALTALLSAFPGGSITGAPKRRAMEIIDQLEPHRRGPYCGSVFYLQSDGTMDSNIAIRTLVTEEDGRISCWGGCGIVADSDPQAEYEESITKVQRLMETLENL